MTYPLTTLDAAATARWLRAAAASVAAARGGINRLNVYPVPDGDTGTNMSLTLAEGCAELDESVTSTPEEVLTAFSHGALLGARGNSGVILSQFFRGMSRSLSTGPDDLGHITPSDLATALSTGCTEAWHAVSRPVTGTILSVLGAVAQSARDLADDGADLAQVVTTIYEHGCEALLRTPEQLEVLARAGVVDAGGRGLIEILATLVDTVTGVLPAIPKDLVRSLEAPEGEQIHDEVVDGEFEVMYVVSVTDTSLVDNTRARLEAIGESVVVVGGDDLRQVHVHTDDPAAAIAAGAQLGARRQVTVRHLPTLAFSSLSGPSRIGAVACTTAPGLAGDLAASGAIVLVTPDDGKPTFEEISRAVTDTGAPVVAILLGDSTYIDIAQGVGTRVTNVEQVIGHGGAVTTVVPDVENPATLLAALSVFDSHSSRPPAEMIAAMSEAARGVALSEVVLSEADCASFDAVARKTQEAIGTVGGSSGVGWAERITVIVGERPCAEDPLLPETLAARCRDNMPAGSENGPEIIAVRGGQTSPDIIVAVE